MSAASARAVEADVSRRWSARLWRRCAGIHQFATSGDSLRPMFLSERTRAYSRVRAA